MAHKKHHIDEVVSAVRRSLTDDLRQTQYRGSDNPLTGHCYVASEALYHLLDGRAHGLKPMHVQHENSPHWFLRDMNTGENIDPTAEQFISPVPYDKARGKGFLTREPSARAATVIERAKKDLGYRRAKLRKSIEDGEEVPVSSVAVFNSKGHILFGKRSKEQKWNLPGGHIEDGESPEECAHREAFEESGLKLKKLKYLGEALAGKKGNIRVHSFAASIEGSEEQTAEHDPDNEMDEFRWVDPKDIPKDISENLYNKRDITLRLLGCQQDEAYEDPLDKMAIADIPTPERKREMMGAGFYDYSHTLTPEHKSAGYSLTVRDPTQGNSNGTIEAEVHHGGLCVGGVWCDGVAEMNGQRRFMPHASLGKDHQGKGVGFAAYEALFAHMKNKHNATHVVGGGSERAVRVHQALAQKHGYQFISSGKSGDNGWRTDYEYALKSEEDLDKVVLDPNAGYTMHHEPGSDDEGNRYITVYAFHGGKAVGGCYFKEGMDELYNDGITHVAEEHRRKGVASAMYAHAEKVTGKKVLPSEIQTDAGRGLWAGNEQNKQFGKSELVEHVPNHQIVAARGGTGSYRWEHGLTGAYSNIDAGRISQTPGPVDGWWLPEEGKYLLVDGHHRFVQHLLAGGKSLDVRRVGEGYSDTWKVPAPNERFEPSPTKYGGLEDIASEDILDDLHAKVIPRRKKTRLNKSEAWHAGDGGLGRDTVLGNMTWGRGTGHFGTGTYFVSHPDKVKFHGDRPMKHVGSMLDGKRLHKPVDKLTALNLHDHLKRVNNLVHDWVGATENPGDEDFFQFPELQERAERISRGLRTTACLPNVTREHVLRAVHNAAGDFRARNTGSESASTRLMRDLGYDGIDVRHLDDLDNTMYGSVVYPPKTLSKSEIEEELQKAVLDPALGYEIRHSDMAPKKGAAPWYTTVSAFHGGKMVGEVEFRHKSYYHISSLSTHVDEAHRRRGLASAMYTYAEKVTGKKVLPSPVLSTDGEALWAGNQKQKQFGKSEAPVERALALKYTGVHHEHLRQGLEDEDPTVRTAAARHPKLSEALLPMAMQDSDPSVVLAAMRNPSLRGLITPEHLDIAHENGHHEVHREIARHPNTSSDQIARMYADVEQPDMYGDDEYIQNLVMHPNAPPGVLEDVLHAALFAGPSKFNESLAVGVMQHPKATSKMVGQVINRYGMYNPAVREAAIRSPHITKGDLFKVLRNYQSDHNLRLLALDNPQVTDDHLMLANADPHPEVRTKAHEKALGKFAKENGLQKAIKPDDFKSVARATDPKAQHVVDHKSQMSAGVPGAVQPSVHLFQKGDPKRVSGSRALNGVSQKALFKVGDEKFMVKPYHERISARLNKWMHAPIQGWAEMTNQALYHAGGIGHLHQKVHIAEVPLREEQEQIPRNSQTVAEDMKWKEAQAKAPKHAIMEPVLAIHMEKGLRPVGEFWNAYTHSDAMKDDVRKIGLMDFLTNNLDRHPENLMVDPDTHRVLGIDHSRSFQYMNKTKDVSPRQIRANDATDSLANYIGTTPFGGGSAIRNMIPKPTRMIFGTHDDYREAFNPTFEWWEKNSNNIRNALYDQLRHIKDEDLKSHIRRNFDVRARQLDQYAQFGLDNFGRTDWMDTEIPMYRPWETDER